MKSLFISILLKTILPVAIVAGGTTAVVKEVYEKKHAEVVMQMEEEIASLENKKPTIDEIKEMIAVSIVDGEVQVSFDDDIYVVDTVEELQKKDPVVIEAQQKKAAEEAKKIEEAKKAEEEKKAEEAKKAEAAKKQADNTNPKAAQTNTASKTAATDNNTQNTNTDNNYYDSSSDDSSSDDSSSDDSSGSDSSSDDSSSSSSGDSGSDSSSDSDSEESGDGDASDWGDLV